jgi:hypothetical protein
MIWNLDGIRLRLQTVCSAASGEFASRRPKSPQAICFVEDDGGVDGTRTRGLRRDRQEALTAHRSRPRKIGVGCPTSWPFKVDPGRVFRNGLQVLAKPSFRQCDSRTARRTGRFPQLVSLGRPAKRDENRCGRIAPAGAARSNRASGAVEAEQLFDPERA